MKKDNITAYAADAFQYYAMCGEPTMEERRECIRNKAFCDTVEELCGCCSDIENPTEYQRMRMEEAEREHEAELLDIEAVYHTLERIRESRNGESIVRVVREVYMTDLERDYREKGYISEKVAALSVELPAGVASIYRWLKKARILFAEERGLRIGKNRVQQVGSRKRKQCANM